MQYNVTVIIPVYNGIPFLPATVNSLLQQTYEDFHLLIVDDGSTDESLAYLLSLTDPRVEIRQQRNLGFGKSLNRSIESVNSDFIFHLDQDDVALPNRLQEQLDFLSSHQEYDFVLSNVSKISSIGIEFGSYIINDTELISDYKSVKYGAISPSTMCFRRKAFLALGGYRESLYPVDDYDLLLRVEENYKVAVINKPLVKYRVHSKSASFKKFYEMQFKTAYIKTLAAMRRSGEPEISLEEFTKQNQDNFLQRTNKYRCSLGMLTFRKAGCLIGEKNYISGVLNLLYACFLVPSFVFNRLSSLRK